MARSIRPVPLWSALLCSGAVLIATPALAQVQIEEALTAPVATATAGDGGVPSDVTIGTGGSITIETEGPALILNSDNVLNNQGQIAINNVDNATGVLLEGGANRNYAQTGTIRIVEDFDEANTDDEPLADPHFASGTGSTGILLSGASPF